MPDQIKQPFIGKDPRAETKRVSHLTFQAHTNLSQKQHKGDELELSTTQEEGKP